MRKSRNIGWRDGHALDPAGGEGRFHDVDAFGRKRGADAIDQCAARREHVHGRIQQARLCGRKTGDLSLTLDPRPFRVAAQCAER